jgi:hypothetical protein
MSIEGHSSQPEASIHENHYCEHPGCQRWCCYGFEQDRMTVKWFCREHQPETYRGLARHGAEA